MPEGLEAEIWRLAAGALVGRTVSAVWCDERVAPDDLAEALVGRTFGGARRRGKVLLLDTDGPTLGLHFGMTGRLIVDGVAAIEELEYASGADRPDWDRLSVHTDGTERVALRMNDPRRLGRISLDPDTDRLGPEAMSLSTDELRVALDGRSAAIKTLLLDQSVVAGLGNLCADEVLFHAGIAPTRAVNGLDDTELGRVAGSCRKRLREMLALGGSTAGVLDPIVRAALPPCPLDGGVLQRRTVGGRTAVWCPTHQR